MASLWRRLRARCSRRREVKLPDVRFTWVPDNAVYVVYEVTDSDGKRYTPPVEK